MSRGGVTRFAKGRSGNPKGRPRKAPPPGASAFDIIIGRTLTVVQNGIERELTIDEALQQRTYQDAIAGSRSARREILKMIARREAWLAAHAPKPARGRLEIVEGHDPQDANDALVLLGIAIRPNDPMYGPGDPYDRLLLEPWAVEAGLARRRKHPLEQKQIDWIRRCTRADENVTWL